MTGGPGSAIRGFATGAGLDGRCDLLRLVGQGGGVQLECRYDQRDELYG